MEIPVAFSESVQYQFTALSVDATDEMKLNNQR